MAGPGTEEAARKLAVAEPLRLDTETATRKLPVAAPLRLGKERAGRKFAAAALLRLGKETAARKVTVAAPVPRHKLRNLLEVVTPELMSWILVRAMCLS